MRFFQIRLNSLQQQSLGVHFYVGLARNIKFVGECERNFSFAHQLFAGVVGRQRILT